MRSLGPSYRWLLTAFTISSVGNGVLIAALPLLVASGTRNPLAISGLMVAAGLPWLLIGPFSGAIVDRVDRRRAMFLAEAARAVVLGAAAVYVFGGGDSIVALYALLVVVGVGETFFDAAGLALVPALVTPAELDTANGRLFSTQTLAQRFLGPPLGGWLFAFATWMPLGVDAVSFLVAAMVVLWLPRGSAREVPPGSGQGVGGRNDRGPPVGLAGLCAASLRNRIGCIALRNRSRPVGPGVGGPGPLPTHRLRLRSDHQRIGPRVHARLPRRPRRCHESSPGRGCV